MKLFGTLLILFSLLCMVGCGETPKNANDLFALAIQNPKKTYQTEDNISVSITNKKGTEITNVSYALDGGEKSKEATFNLTKERLGERTVTAYIQAEDQEYVVSSSFTITASNAPKMYGYTILETYPHDIQAYTQGLEFENDTLYESTGQRGESSLRKIDVNSGKILNKVVLGNQYFGEGVTVMGDNVYQLTWQENTGFIYNKTSLEQKGTFVYGKSREGWGLCNDGTVLYKSDGTEKIWTLNPETLAEERYIQLYTHNRKIPKVNELEWVEGRIYANIYQKDAIAIVNPNNGAVEGVINCKGLQEQVTQHDELDVLNGIAYKGEPNILYVTGKNWDKIFKVEIIEK